MTKLSDGRVFSCPSCGHDTVEEYISGVAQICEILSYEKCDGGWNPVYGEPRFEGGECHTDQCANCGEELDDVDIEDNFVEITDETNTDIQRP